MISLTSLDLNTYMATGVVWIGITLNAQDDLRYIHRTRRLGILRPKRADDGTEFMAKYQITYNDEAINIPEYTHRLVEDSSIFCLFIE